MPSICSKQATQSKESFNARMAIAECLDLRVYKNSILKDIRI